MTEWLEVELRARQALMERDLQRQAPIRGHRPHHWRRNLLWRKGNIYSPITSVRIHVRLTWHEDTISESSAHLFHSKGSIFG